MRALITKLVGVAALAVVAGSAFAGGSFGVPSVNKSGVVPRWQNNTATWYADKGDFGGDKKNAEAVAMVQAAFDAWANVQLENAEVKKVKTSSFAHAYKGLASADITAANLEEDYLSEKNTRSYIIFDADGSITQDLLGRDKRTTVGLSQPLTYDSSGRFILQGVVILNGYLYTQGVLSWEQMQAATIHEIGHFIGLDHTQINQEEGLACSESETCDSGSIIPTMYPFLVDELQGLLKIDDIVTLSWIYPAVSDASQKFHPDFGTITGVVRDASGQDLKGVNVIAMRDEGSERMAQVDARSMVSGSAYPGFSGDARYTLFGLVPGRKYKVICEPIYKGFTGDSGLEPISNPPADFPPCEAVTPDGIKQVSVGTGETLEMAPIELDVANPCPQSICGSPGSAPGANTSSGSSSCSLAAARAAGSAASLLLFGISLLPLLLCRRRLG